MATADPADSAGGLLLAGVNALPGQADTASISVIIVSYNTAGLLSACLDALGEQAGHLREIIVVDNASADGSVRLVREEYPGVRLLALAENIGFGRANNLGMEIAGGELLFLLNPDTRVLPGCFAAMRRFMAGHPEVGMAGTAVFGDNGDRHTTVQFDYPGARYLGRRFAALPGTIAWLLGASLVVRPEVMEQVKGFDPDFFLYGEDIDLSLRVRKAGWQLGFIEEAGIVHLGGQSERATRPADLFEKKMRGELLFIDKHYPPATVRRIRRARRLQAWWRVASLRLAACWPGDRQALQSKLTKYLVATRVYR